MKQTKATFKTTVWKGDAWSYLLNYWELFQDWLEKGCWGRLFLQRPVNKCVFCCFIHFNLTPRWLHSCHIAGGEWQKCTGFCCRCSDMDKWKSMEVFHSSSLKESSPSISLHVFINLFWGPQPHARFLGRRIVHGACCQERKKLAKVFHLGRVQWRMNLYRSENIL